MEGWQTAQCLPLALRRVVELVHRLLHRAELLALALQTRGLLSSLPRAPSASPVRGMGRGRCHHRECVCMAWQQQHERKTAACRASPSCAEKKTLGKIRKKKNAQSPHFFLLSLPLLLLSRNAYPCANLTLPRAHTTHNTFCRFVQDHNPIIRHAILFQNTMTSQLTSPCGENCMNNNSGCFAWQKKQHGLLGCFFVRCCSGFFFSRVLSC